MVMGFVRKKNATVRWKRHMEEMIVLAEMSAIFGAG
jgi:hypothetical protein